MVTTIRAERIRCFAHIVNTVNPPYILKGLCLIDPLYFCTVDTAVVVTYIDRFVFFLAGCALVGTQAMDIKTALIE